MSEIVIRRVTQADKEALYAIRMEALQTNPEAFGADYQEMLENHTIDSYASRIPAPDSDDQLIVAEHEGTLVGMLGFVRNTRLKTKHTGFIWGVFVSPTVRGKGVGRQMMVATMDHIHKCQGLAQVQLSVVTENTAAIAFYEGFGFVTWGTEPDGLRVGEKSYDLHYMNYAVPQK